MDLRTLAAQPEQLAAKEESLTLPGRSKSPRGDSRRPCNRVTAHTTTSGCGIALSQPERAWSGLAGPTTMGRCFVLFPEDRVRGCRLLSAPQPCQHADPCLLRPQGRGGGTGASPPPPRGAGRELSLQHRAAPAGPSCARRSGGSSPSRPTAQPCSPDRLNGTEY